MSTTDTDQIIDATTPNALPVDTSAATSGAPNPDVPAKRVAGIGLVLAGIWFLHLALDFVEVLGRAPFAGAIFFIGIASFYGWSSSGVHMRTTITATFVSIYVAMVAAFLTSSSEGELLSTQVGQQVWEGFTWLVGAIVISYFGASVASEAIGRFRDVGGSAAPTT